MRCCRLQIVVLIQQDEQRLRMGTGGMSSTSYNVFYETIRVPLDPKCARSLCTRRFIGQVVFLRRYQEHCQLVTLFDALQIFCLTLSSSSADYLLMQLFCIEREDKSLRSELGFDPKTQPRRRMLCMRGGQLSGVVLFVCGQGVTRARGAVGGGTMSQLTSRAPATPGHRTSPLSPAGTGTVPCDESDHFLNIDSAIISQRSAVASWQENELRSQQIYYT